VDKQHRNALRLANLRLPCHALAGDTVTVKQLQDNWCALNGGSCPAVTSVMLTQTHICRGGVATDHIWCRGKCQGLCNASILSYALKIQRAVTVYDRISCLSCSSVVYGHPDLFCIDVKHEMKITFWECSRRGQ
jgi:hypothetical protein